MLINGDWKLKIKYGLGHGLLGKTGLLVEKLAWDFNWAFMVRAVGRLT